MLIKIGGMNNSGKNRNSGKERTLTKSMNEDEEHSILIKSWKNNQKTEKLLLNISGCD